MKLLPIILTLFLHGCYLANGSPSSASYWFRNGKAISYRDIKACENQVYSSLGERFLYLHRKDEYDNTISSQEREEYSEYLANARKYVNNCFYNLGFRFNPPLYWCLAQDGDNTKICIENMKYRN